MDSMIERVARAIAGANAERAYGLYDYSGYPGDAPPHVVRHERTNEVLLRTNDRDEAQALYDRLTAEHPAIAAIKAMREPTAEMLEAYWHCTGESHAMRNRVELRAARYHRAMIDACLAILSPGAAA